ncbi:hypothetical protein CEXT_9281 [Caerostris extrusa]|uniref:Ribosomal protein S14 n=1 Tax=Caerostris extrusa TaxID=172846 RepID=A0AAV4W9B0_CAEEX|nr:hypothetical protein CEXT_9281 [Caerostris extrusa]
MALKSIFKIQKEKHKSTKQKRNLCHLRQKRKLAHYRLIPKRVRARAVLNNKYTFKETGFIPRSEYAIVLTVQKQLVYKIYPRSNRTKTRCPWRILQAENCFLGTRRVPRYLLLKLKGKGKHRCSIIIFSDR